MFIPAGILRRLPFDALVAVDRTLGSKLVGVATRRDSMFMFCNTLRMQTIIRMQMYRVARDLRMKVLSTIAQGSHSYVVNVNVTHMGI